MKKFLKRAMCVFLSVLMAATTLVAGTFSVSAATGSAADSLLSAIQGYESKMAENKIYTNMSAAYEAYVTACNWYDKYVLGTDSTNEATQVSTAATQLVTATNNMKEIADLGSYNPSVTYATAAANSAYSASDLSNGGDYLWGSIYSYGVHHNSSDRDAGEATMNDYSSYAEAGYCFGSVVFLKSNQQDEQGYAFPVTEFNKKSSSTRTAYISWFNFYGSDEAVEAMGAPLNDGAFVLKSNFHASGTEQKGYSTGNSKQVGYSKDSTTDGNATTSTSFYSNTLYYEGTLDADEYVKIYDQLDYECYNGNHSKYIFGWPAEVDQKWTDSTTEATAATMDRSSLGNSYNMVLTNNQTEGSDSRSTIYIINWQALLDAINTYVGTTSPIVQVYNYREGGLSDYIETIDNLTRINPTLSNSSDPNGWVSNDYYIDNSSTTAGVKEKVSNIQNAMETYIPQLQETLANAKTDKTIYNQIRDDSTYEYGWSTAVDDNGQRIYGIADLQTMVYEYGQYKRDEDGNVTTEKVYDDASWAIFTEAYKLAQAVLRYGAENGYNNDYPISNYGNLLYNGVLLDGVDIENYTYGTENYGQYDGTNCPCEIDELEEGDYYYKLIYDANGDGTLSVEEVCAALSRAYENLQYHFILDVVDADILYEVIKEAELLIQNSSYFTEQTFTDANLKTLIAQAKILVWGSEDNYGIKAELLENNEENQKIVDDEVATLVGIANGAGVEGLYIDWQKTVSSAGGYSLSSITAICNALDESIYTANSWEALQEILAEKDLYLGTGSETYGSRNVTIDVSSATKVAGSAYQYIENYIALVRDIYYAYLSLEKSFTSIENGEIANVGETVTATTYTTGSQSGKDYLWRLNMEYQQGLVFFRTNNEEYLFDLQNPQFSFQCKADYDSLLDSISIDAQHDYTGYFSQDSSGNWNYGLDESNGHGTTHKISGDNSSWGGSVTSYGISESLRAQYPGGLSIATDNGQFGLYNIYVTGQTAAADYIGYEASLNDGARVPVMSMGYDWTGALSTTEGNDEKDYGGQGPIGGILSHSRDDNNSWGETDFTATYTYTMPEYEKEDLYSHPDLILTQEDTEYGLGMVAYEKTYGGWFNTYKEYWMGASAYNPKVSVVDITYLFDLIDLAESLRENDYTTASWNNFMEAYNAAVDYMPYTSMSATEIYSVSTTRYDNLWEAIKALVHIATLNVKDCNGKTIDLETSQYSYTKDDENNTVTLTLDSLDWDWYVDDTAVYTITQAGTFNITIHTDCEVTTTTLPAQCSVAGYRDTSTYCKVCDEDVGSSHEVLEMTEKHEMSDWAYSVYATDEHKGQIERHCTNMWDGSAYGTAADGCDYYETEDVAVKVDPILEVDLAEVENTEEGGIYFAYPEGSKNDDEHPVGDDEYLDNDKQYVIEFEYTGDADEVLNWELYFTDKNGDPVTGYLEGRDYTIYYTSGGLYKDKEEDNEDQKLCTVSFRSAKAQEAWDEGTLIVNANTAIFTLGITAVDCQGNDIMADIDFDIYSDTGDQMALTSGTTEIDENTFAMKYFKDVAATYTVNITKDNGYTLDSASITSSTIGDRDYEDLQLIFHKDVTSEDDVTYPTCTEQGYTITTTTCTDCNEVVSVEKGNYTDATGHTYGAPEIIDAATCTTDGTQRYTCTNGCGTYYDEVLSATGHTWVEDPNKEAVSPTCSTDGYAYYICSNCSEEKTVTISATSHDYEVSNTVDPGCETEGYTEYKCNNCGDTFRSTTPATGHMWRITDTQAATCMEAGSVEYECFTCGETKTEPIAIDENAHDWVLDEDASVAPTCTENGKNVYKCNNGCGKTLEEEISSDTAHNFYKEDGKTLNYKYTAPDCETAGSDVYTCTICGAEFTVEIPATGHNYEKAYTIAAGCETPEYTVYACANCVSKITASLENGNVVVDATPAEGCKIYDPQYDSDGEWVEGTGSYAYGVSAEATGHAYRYDEDKSNPATCGANGTEVYTCQNCGDSYTVEVEPTGDHTWDDGVSIENATCDQEGEILYTCTTCGATYTETVPKAHTWPEDGDTEHINVTEATCVDGSIEYYCTECEELITTEVIPATGHSYKTKVVDPLCEEEGYTIYYCEYCVDENSIESAVNTSNNEFDADKVTAEDGYSLTEDSFYTGDTVAAHGHYYQYNEDESSEATCTTDGKDVYTCTACGKNWENTLTALGHNWDDGTIVEQTCVKNGTLTHTCKRDGCGETDTETIPADGTSHTWSEESKVEPTCTTDGYYKCTNTDESGTQCEATKTIPATGHSPEFTVSVPATCETDGYDLYLCSACVDASTVSQIEALAAQVEDSAAGIEAAKQLDTLIGTLDEGQYSAENIDNAFGHTCTVTETPATCTETGLITYTCTICGSVFTEPIPALSDNGEHTWDDGVVTKEATCVAGGTTLYTCAVCGETKTESTAVDKVNGHSYKLTSSTDATCQQKGSKTYTCEYCKDETTEYTDTIDHDMVQIEIKAPTCTDYGYTLYKCSMCGTEEQRDKVEAYGHLWREDESKSQAATCTTAGYTYNVCAYCGATDTITIPATGHNWVDGDVITYSTCTTQGTVKRVCSVCGEESSETGTLPVDPNAHTWDEGKVTTEATCTTDGEITYTCTEDSSHTKTEVIPATGHSYVDIVVAPTHDSNGYTIHICENCSSTGAVANLQSLAAELQGYVEKSQSDAEATMEAIASALAAEDEDCYYTDTDKSALGHDYGTTASETKAATCDTAGYNRWVCSCGDYIEVEIPATGDHNWDAGTVSKEATHDSTGTMVYKCKDCGATKSATIPKVGYSWGEWYTVKAATHLAEGQQRRDCNCGNSWCTSSETKSIAKLTQHTYKAVVTAPSCTSAGYTTYTCECGDQYIDNVIEALGHNWDSGKVTKSATCNATGTKTYTCTKCGATKEESIAKTSHTYTTTKTAATCTKQGYTTYTCKTCGYSYKSNYTDAKGHNYEFTKYSVKATRNKNGQKLYTCTRCGKTKTTSFAKIKSWKLSSTSATYTGKNITPKITIKDANGNTISSQYYYYRIYCEKTQNVVGRINWVDKYYIEVVMKTKYSGEIMVGEFTVKPKSRSISSISKGSKSFTVKWKALKSSQITGYQIQYSTDKNFKNKKTITVKGSSKSSKKIKGLKGNKKYYVRIRTYKTRKDLKWYSSWSSVKSVTTKK